MNVFGAPAGSGSGRGGRLQHHDRGPRRRRACEVLAAARRDEPHRARPTSSRQLAGLFTVFKANSPQLLPRRRPRPRAWRTGVDLRDVFADAAGLPGLALRQRLQPLRPHLAGGRAGRRAFRDELEDVKRLKVRNTQRRDGAAGRGGRRSQRRSAGRWSSRATTCTPPPSINGNVRAGRQHRRGDRGRWKRAGRTRTCRDRWPSSGPSWTFLEIAVAATPAMLVFALVGGVRVPGAGGPVRELGAAAGRHPGGADVRARRRSAGVAGRPSRTSTSSRRSASWCWSAWRARTPS